jgi:methionine biosynthesis protein MetW
MLAESKDKSYSNEGNNDVLDLVEGKGSLILDVGCGSGSLARRLNANGHTVDGITISEEELRQAKPFVRKVFLYNLEGGLPVEIPDGEYDYVICSHVLEHIAYPQKLLTDILRVLKPGGSLIVALPNVMHYKSRLRLMAGRFDYTDAGIWDYTHVRWYTVDSAKEMLSKSGFTITRDLVTGELPLNSVAKRVLPPGLRKGIYGFLTSFSKGLFGYQMLFKAAKKG